MVVYGLFNKVSLLFSVPFSIKIPTHTHTHTWFVTHNYMSYCCCVVYRIKLENRLEIFLWQTSTIKCNNYYVYFKSLLTIFLRIEEVQVPSIKDISLSLSYLLKWDVFSFMQNNDTLSVMLKIPFVSTTTTRTWLKYLME